MEISGATSCRLAISLGALVLILACRQKGNDELFPALASSPGATTTRGAKSNETRASNAPVTDSLRPHDAVIAMTQTFLKDGMLDAPERLRQADSILVVAAYMPGRSSILGDTARVQFITQTAGYLVSDSVGRGSSRRRYVQRFTTETTGYVASRAGGQWQPVGPVRPPFVFASALRGRTDVFTLSAEDWKRIGRLIRAE